ncbi:MAG: nucleotidyl transferase AbiEii/AbiGii toxin family protein [Thermoleophilaceae bacterium]
MSIALLELAADALGELIEDVVFVGGATLTLWITDPGAPPLRPTKDVDVVVEVTTRTAFHEFERRLRSHSFSEDQEDGVVCRWRHPNGLILDAMPSDPSILGFANQWQGQAIPHAASCNLPSGVAIRAASPPYLLATKIEAFKGRGRGDYLGSRDFADIIALVDGREELIDEVGAALPDVQTYLAAELRELLGDPRFPDGIFAALRPDAASQARAETVILPRLRALGASR